MELSEINLITAQITLVTALLGLLTGVIGLVLGILGLKKTQVFGALKKAICSFSYSV